MIITSNGSTAITTSGAGATIPFAVPSNLNLQFLRIYNTGVACLVSLDNFTNGDGNAFYVPDGTAAAYEAVFPIQLQSDVPKLAVKRIGGSDVSGLFISLW